MRFVKGNLEKSASPFVFTNLATSKTQPCCSAKPHVFRWSHWQKELDMRATSASDTDFRLWFSWRKCQLATFAWRLERGGSSVGSHKFRKSIVEPYG